MLTHDGQTTKAITAGEPGLFEELKNDANPK